MSTSMNAGAHTPRCRGSSTYAEGGSSKRAPPSLNCRVGNSNKLLQSSAMLPNTGLRAAMAAAGAPISEKPVSTSAPQDGEQRSAPTSPSAMPVSVTAQYAVPTTGTSVKCGPSGGETSSHPGAPGPGCRHTPKRSTPSRSRSESLDAPAACTSSSERGCPRPTMAEKAVTSPSHTLRLWSSTCQKGTRCAQRLTSSPSPPMHAVSTSWRASTGPLPYSCTRAPPPPSANVLDDALS
mmetsp:Transcript_6960/g.18807  ORF Transcript_6960/g.18807 Transcript_6960/m.18807 type:complete len:237 (-) Transcript_6960:204-914(-)